jgi:hypothetical protein
VALVKRSGREPKSNGDCEIGPSNLSFAFQSSVWPRKKKEKCFKAQRGSFSFFADADDDVFRLFPFPTLLISNVPRMTNGWLGSFSSCCCYSFVYLYEMDSSPKKKKKKKKKNL